MSPSAPVRGCAPNEDVELIGGDGDPNNPANKKYFVKKDSLLTVQALMMMRDPLVWGEDADAFRPERMMGGAFEKLPVRHIRHCLSMCFLIASVTVPSLATFWLRNASMHCKSFEPDTSQCYGKLYLYTIFREGHSHGKKHNSSLQPCFTSSTSSLRIRGTL